MQGNSIFDFSKLFRRFSGLVLLNISGLARGLAAVIFIAIWLSHELSYDKFYKDSDRIFRVESLINFSGDPSVSDSKFTSTILTLGCLFVLFDQKTSTGS